MTTRTDTRTAAELEEAILDGDTSITAADIAAAQAREHHQQLLAEAQSRAEIRAIEEQRKTEIAALRADIEAVTTDIDGITDHAQAATAALNALVEAVEAHNSTVTQLAGRARTLSVEPMTSARITVDPSGIGWSSNPGRDANVALNDRVLGTSTPLDLISRITRDVIARHKLRNRTWRGGVEPTVAAQLEGLERTITPAVQVPVRLHRRWGQHPAGAIVQADTGDAAWLVAKDMAERV